MTQPRIYHYKNKTLSFETLDEYQASLAENDYTECRILISQCPEGFQNSYNKITGNSIECFGKNNKIPNNIVLTKKLTSTGYWPVGAVAEVPYVPNQKIISVCSDFIITGFPNQPITIDLQYVTKIHYDYMRVFTKPTEPSIQYMFVQPVNTNFTFINYATNQIALNLTPSPDASTIVPSGKTYGGKIPIMFSVVLMNLNQANDDSIDGFDFGNNDVTQIVSDESVVLTALEYTNSSSNGTITWINKGTLNLQSSTLSGFTIQNNGQLTLANTTVSNINIINNSDLILSTNTGTIDITGFADITLYGSNGSTNQYSCKRLINYSNDLTVDQLICVWTLQNFGTISVPADVTNISLYHLLNYTGTPIKVYSQNIITLYTQQFNNITWEFQAPNTIIKDTTNLFDIFFNINVTNLTINPGACGFNSTTINIPSTISSITFNNIAYPINIINLNAQQLLSANVTGKISGTPIISYNNINYDNTLTGYQPI